MRTMHDVDMDFTKYTPNNSDRHTCYLHEGRLVSLGEKLRLVTTDVRALENYFDSWLLPLLIESAKKGEYNFIIDYNLACEHKATLSALQDWCEDNQLQVGFVSNDSEGKEGIFIKW